MDRGLLKCIIHIFAYVSWEFVTGHGHFGTRNTKSTCQISQADYLTEIIESARTNGLTYQFQENADNYRPKYENPVKGVTVTATRDEMYFGMKLTCRLAEPLFPFRRLTLYRYLFAGKDHKCGVTVTATRDEMYFGMKLTCRLAEPLFPFRRLTLYRYLFAGKDHKCDFGTYDFIIVGAGSGGTVVASRLSENRKFKVLLLEAGNYGNNLTDIPNMYFPVAFTEYNWGFFSTPQETSCLGMVDKKCILPRGRGIGGSTLINGEVYARGSRIDFDRWAKHVNDSRWSYKRVLPYFKKSEHFHHRDKAAPVFPPIHGTNGLLNVEYHLPESPQLVSWLKANEELGFPVADYNAGTGLGVSPAQLNTRNGRRLDGGKAFVRPFLNRTNLRVVTYAYVTKILTNSLRSSAEGVIFALGKKKYIARARKEVILSAGAFQTPQLLMLSGIGPKKHLDSLKIPVIKNLEVGSFLKDHPSFYGMVFSSNYTEPIKSEKEYVEEFLNGYGPLAAPGNNQGVGFYESQYTNGSGYPDIEIMIIPANATTDLSQRGFWLTDQTYDDLWKSINRSQSYIMYAIAVHAESTGSVRLKSADPYDYPIIDPRYLSDPHNKDINTIYEGVQLALKLSKTKALQEIGSKLVAKPLKACENLEYFSKPYWYCAIRQVTKNIYHPVSSCPMGPNPDKGDVVDSECRVHGVKKLRVVDASVFPFTLAGHPNAPIVMVGEVVSDIIKNEYK